MLVKGAPCSTAWTARCGISSVIHHLICVLPRLLWYCIQFYTILDRIVTPPNRIDTEIAPLAILNCFTKVVVCIQGVTMGNSLWFLSQKE